MLRLSLAAIAILAGIALFQQLRSHERPRPSGDWRLFSSPAGPAPSVGGFRVLVPPGWRARVRPDGSLLVTTYAEQSDDLPPRPPRGEAYALVVHYGDVPGKDGLSDVPELGAPARMAIFGTAYNVNWQVRDNAFQAFAVAPDAEQRAEVRAMLETVRPTK
jgi:hypothetical protein